MYDHEQRTSTIPEGLIPGMYNRVTTDGIFGIWGHRLGDLVLNTTHCDPATGIYDLVMDS
jgi:hypothetical protein